YQVMNGLDGVKFCDVDDADKVPEFSAPGVEVIEALLDWGRVDGLTFSNVESMLYVLWGMLHGLVALAMGRRLQTTPEQTRDLIAQAVATLLAGWRQGAHRSS